MPVGRHNVAISYVSYGLTVLPNVTVTSGKEVILNVELTEAIAALKEVIINYAGGQKKPGTNPEWVFDRKQPYLFH